MWTARIPPHASWCSTEASSSPRRVPPRSAPTSSRRSRTSPSPGADFTCRRTPGASIPTVSASSRSPAMEPRSSHAPAASQAPRAARAGRPLLLAWVHLTVLWSFAFAKPLFDVLADSPEFFVARGNTTGDVVLCAFGLVLVPPTLLWLVELALTVAPRVRRPVHLVFVGSLVTTIAMQIFKGEATGPGIPLTALAL